MGLVHGVIGKGEKCRDHEQVCIQHFARQATDIGLTGPANVGLEFHGLFAFRTDVFGIGFGFRNAFLVGHAVFAHLFLRGMALFMPEKCEGNNSDHECTFELF